MASTGSLGHGLPIAAGYSYAIKKSNNKSIVICVTGDGDLQEGSNLEVLHSLLKLKDCELKIINDDNSSVESDFVNVERFFSNLENNYKNLEIIKNFDMCYFQNHEKLSEWLIKPGLKIANCKTIKGFGFKEMYNNPKWHAGIPSHDEYTNFLNSSDFSLKNEK